MNQDLFHEIKLSEVYNRIGQTCEAKKNRDGEYLKVDIAKALGVDSQDLSNWSFRKKIPWAELYLYAKSKKLPMEWLLTGKESDNYDYIPKNKKYHDVLEYILQSDNPDAVNAFIINIKGVLMYLDQDKTANSITNIEAMLKTIVDGMGLKSSKKEPGRIPEDRKDVSG